MLEVADLLMVEIVVFCCREENSLVDTFVFEILVTFVECLALAHSDDKVLGILSSEILLLLELVVLRLSQTKLFIF